MKLNNDRQNELPKNCPHCRAQMIEDAWERIEFFPNGNIEVEPIYPAWICSKMCGFYIEIK